MISGMTQHDHARKVCATILQTVMGHKGDIDLQHQFGRTKLFLTEQQVRTDLGCGGQELVTEGSLIVDLNAFNHDKTKQKANFQ